MDKTALVELRERVRKATGPDRELDAGLYPLCDGRLAEIVPHWTDDQREELIPCYTASIDAALGLVKKVLPGGAWELTTPTAHYLYARASCWYRERTPDRTNFEGTGETLPLAILDTLLSALIDQQEE